MAQCDESDVCTQAIMCYLSNKMQAEQTRLRQAQEAKIVQEQAQQEQCVAASVMLQSLVPSLELEQALGLDKVQSVMLTFPVDALCLDKGGSGSLRMRALRFESGDDEEKRLLGWRSRTRRWTSAVLRTRSWLTA